MKIRPTAFALVIAVAPAAAQITSGPGICFAFNTNTTAGSSYVPLVAGGELYLGLTAPVTASVERIDVGTSFPSSSVISVQVFQSIGTTLGPLVGSGASLSPSSAGLLVLGSPVPLTAGSSYAVRLTVAAGFVVLSGDFAQTTPISYLLNCGAAPPVLFPSCSSYAVTGTFGARMLFRSSTCGQTPYATATQVGTGCGAGSSLATITPPVLGAPFTFIVSGFFQSGSCQVFWAAGPATAGLNLGLGSGCTSYLDPVSLQSLAAAGAEPLVTFPIMGTASGTNVSIPLNPALAGVTVTTQAVLLLSTPSIPTPWGNLAITNALELTLGY